MFLLTFAQWIQLTDFFTYVRSSTFFYPIVLSLHMCGIAMFGGMILLGDLRMLGAMRQYKVSDFIAQLRTPKRYGLLLMVTMGAILAGSKAEEYYYNTFFRVK